LPRAAPPSLGYRPIAASLYHRAVLPRARIKV